MVRISIISSVLEPTAFPPPRFQHSPELSNGISYTYTVRPLFYTLVLKGGGGGGVQAIFLGGSILSP